MKSPRALTLVVLLVATATIAQAAKVDMRDPRRAVGREDDVRVDAELSKDTIASHSNLGITYQIQNLTTGAIAFADKVVDTSYDVDTQTITVSFGAEIPAATMPHLVVIRPGETRTFRGGGSVTVNAPNTRSPWVSLPRYVQIKVTVLRDLKPFAGLIDQQNKTAAAPSISNEVFDRWVERVGSVFLNPIPVRWDPKGPNHLIDAEDSAPGGGGF